MAIWWYPQFHDTGTDVIRIVCNRCFLLNCYSLGSVIVSRKMKALSDNLLAAGQMRNFITIRSVVRAKKILPPTILAIRTKVWLSVRMITKADNSVDERLLTLVTVDWKICYINFPDCWNMKRERQKKKTINTWQMML